MSGYAPNATASGLTADQWRQAWSLAAPVVVAARRYRNAVAEGNAALKEDAWFQLMRAIADHDVAPSNCEELPKP